MAAMHAHTASVSAARSRIISRLIILAVSATPLAAQAPAGRMQFVVPPSTWRVTVSGEVLPATGVKADAQRPTLYPADVGVTRATARLSAPVWKRGLYTTIVTNDIIFDRFELSYGVPTTGGPNVPPVLLPFGPTTLQSVQHELGVSHAINPRWRVTGALQHGVFAAGGSAFDANSYRAAGGAFVSRVYRPTLQVGAGVVALNIAPYVIPTIRILHVGQKWRTDVLIPRAETFRDIGHGMEVGGVLRFLGNRWDGEERLVERNRFRRTTYQQAMLGPALTWRVASHGLVQVESGIALRRLLVEGSTTNPALASSGLPFARRFDTEAGAQLRVSGRLTF